VVYLLSILCAQYSFRFPLIRIKSGIYKKRAVRNCNAVKVKMNKVNALTPVAIAELSLKHSDVSEKPLRRVMTFNRLVPHPWYNWYTK
jgi:hypothetical protein